MIVMGLVKVKDIPALTQKYGKENVLDIRMQNEFIANDNPDMAVLVLDSPEDIETYVKTGVGEESRCRNGGALKC